MNKSILILAAALTGQLVLAEPLRPIRPIPKPPIKDPIRPPVIPPRPRPPILDPGGPGATVTTTKHLNATVVANEIDRVLSTAQMKLNNHHGQTSFMQVQGVRLGFQIPRATVDIDCGTFCPDLGDGHFYVNDVNLERADFTANPGTFVLTLDFEDAGREIKGYHSVLGDVGMPDFQMDRPLLRIYARPVVQNGQVSLSFSGARLTADIQSTGGCNVGGIDICNKIASTDRKIERAVEAAAQNALNGSLIQGALRIALTRALQSLGVNGAVRSVRLVGYDLQVTL